MASAAMKWPQPGTFALIMDSSQYREVLIGLDRALFIFHEVGSELTERDHSLETAIASIRRDVLRTWAGYPCAHYDPVMHARNSPPTIPRPSPQPVPE